MEMDNTNGGSNKNLWIGGLVVLVLVIVFVFWNMSSDTGLPSGETNTTPTTEETPAVNLEDTSEGSVNTGAPAASISYANALIKYKDARIQLDKTCQASPDKMTFKNNTVIMLDNRSPMDRVVKVGSALNIKAYGFKLVKLSSDTLPATWYVDCDKSQNVSTILIQK